MNRATTPQGWQAQLDLAYGMRGEKTCLINKQQRGPLTLQRSFYPEGEVCHNYILHPPGGVVGGDSLEINVDAQSGAHALLTTPGAAKFYRSRDKLEATQYQNFAVANGAVLEWLPQQNIFFPGANIKLATRIDIASGGKFAGWEMHCFGRPANDEQFTFGTLHSRTEVRLAGELRMLEQLNTIADETLLSATGLRGMAMQGCFIAAPCTEQERDLLAQVLHGRNGTDYPHPIGLTLVDEILVVRALGDQAEPMHNIFSKLWSTLRGQWLDRSPCVPRIWAT
ncbi:MAG: urease accessory protein UreD [Halioglobus sp.]